MSSCEPRPRLPAGYRFETEPDVTPAIVRMYAASSEMAAIGRVVVSGQFAVYDTIATDAAHRRRGLAGAVVGALRDIAEARDIERGVLVATAEGRDLYERLGFRLHALFTTAVIPAAAANR